MVSLYFLHGVGQGVGERDHIERSRIAWAYRRGATPAEVAMLPDLGIVGDYKRKLMGR